MVEKTSESRAVLELDRKLAAVLKLVTKGPPEGIKREKVRHEFRAVREQIIDENLRTNLDDLFQGFLETRPRPDAEKALEQVRSFLERSFVKTGTFLFFLWKEVLNSVGLQRVLPIAPNAACFEAWRKVAKVPAHEIEKQLLADPNGTYATAGAEWLLERAKPQQLLPGLELFLSRQARSAYLRPWWDGLALALKKDKRGILLSAILRHPWPVQDRIAALAEAVRLNRTLLRTTIDLLPTILSQKDCPTTIIDFIGEIFRTVLSTEGAEREFMTAALARLGTGTLLAERQGQQSKEVLALIHNTAQQLRNLTRDDSLQNRTWLLENLTINDQTTDEKLQITAEGARHIALAFEKAEQGFAAKDILTVTARNLGLSPIERTGAVVSYNPLQHEDFVGGLVPGDRALVEQGGWAINQNAVIRAKVRRAKGESHV